MIARVLIIDDDVPVLRALEKKSYDICASSSGEEAIELFRTDQFDGVLTDIKMPEMTGLEILDAIHNIRPEIPVILMTAYADLEVVDAIKKVAFDFLIKPYHPDHLVHAVEKAIKYSQYLKWKEDYREYLEEMVKKRTLELDNAKKEAESLSQEIVNRLITVAEFRDTESGAMSQGSKYFLN